MKVKLEPEKNPVGEVLFRVGKVSDDDLGKDKRQKTLLSSFSPEQVKFYGRCGQKIYTISIHMRAARKLF